MLTKKLFILVSAAVISTSALAGGASNYTASSSSVSSADQTGLYVGVNAGWEQLGWKDQLDISPGTWNSAGSNGTFVMGGDIGYSFNQYLALEVGGFWPTNNAKLSSGDLSFTFKTWDLYVAGKGTVPLYESLNVFGKLGLAYTHTNNNLPSSNTVAAVGTQNTYRPIFAAGLGYDFAQDWNVNAQYAFILGRQSNGRTYSPNQNIYTLGVAYTFAL